MPVWTIVVALLVSTQTGATPNSIRHLMEQVSRIFSAADVQIRWTEQAEPGALVVTLVRAVPPFPGCKSAFGCSVLEIGGPSRTAFIASEAVWQYERPRPAVRGRLLSFVVAHELGHLIGLRHTRERGIMFPNTERLPHVHWTSTERTALAAILTPDAAVHVDEFPPVPEPTSVQPLSTQVLLTRHSQLEPIRP